MTQNPRAYILNLPANFGSKQMTDRAPLSEREIEILRLVATGASNKEIAAKLVISSNTVKVHLRNIFSKIGVASRTEATLYAIQENIAELPGIADSIPERVISNKDIEAADVHVVPPPVRSGRSRYWGVAVSVVLLVIALGSGVFWVASQTQPATVSASPVAAAGTSRWQQRAPMQTARAGLGAAVVNDQIYVIAGETSEGITDSIERFDPSTNSWGSLAPKPTAVADVGAAVVGGKIYVPGGRLDPDYKRISDSLEVYDPRHDQWETRATLPVPVSAYALATFEGKVFLFGGWDGARYLNSVYRYDPEKDQWSELTPMPTERGYAGASVIGNEIFVIGGFDGQKALAVNEEYSPAYENVENPWRERSSLPSGRYGAGISSISNMIYVIGGESSSGAVLPSLEYSESEDRWSAFPSLEENQWAFLATIPLGTQVYSMGGKVEGRIVDRNIMYRAIYTILLPMLP